MNDLGSSDSLASALKSAGWVRHGEVRRYDRQTIFDYIDGAGEVYLLYDFQSVLVYEYRRSESPLVMVEIFDMNSAADAYGIWTFYHEGDDVQLGVSGYTRPGYLAFWQDKYFVIVSTENARELDQSELNGLGRVISAGLPAGGTVPAWVRRFPHEALTPQSLRFFHDHRALNYHYFLSEDNVLALDQQTDCALARFSHRKSTFHHLWVSYPDSARAEHALHNYREMSSSLDTTLAVNKENRSWSAADRYQQFVLLVLDAPTQAVADSLLQESLRSIREEDQ